jgi:hypothetical protein
MGKKYSGRARAMHLKTGCGKTWLDTYTLTGVEPVNEID